MSVEVSVLIPVFNGAKFVRQAYQQIEKQQLVNAESILVNTNSTDEIPFVLKELQALDDNSKKVKLVKPDNLNLSKN
ncbi:glycosyltransferase [Ascidiimonas sp. W6]|uniref:glycosyltransferase n=1 Tax=Ascidiimonas meishanensis TaxID=3128903 RepID=UPI0030EBB46D